MASDYKIRTLNKGLCISMCLMILFKFGEESDLSGLLMLFMLVFIIVNDIKMNNSFKFQMKSIASSAAIAGILTAFYLEILPIINVTYIDKFEYFCIIIFFSAFLLEVIMYFFAFIFKGILNAFKGDGNSERKI